MIVKYCIPTCKANAQETLEVLIPSMISCGIKQQHIIVVEGGHEIRKLDNNKYGVQYIKTNHNSFDYTALIDIVENNIEADFYFNIHDTCKVGPRFLDVVNNSDFNLQKIALYNNTGNGSSMAMGLLNYNYLQQHKQLIQTFKNTDYSHEGLKKAKYRAVEMEDDLFWKLDDVECGCYTRGEDRKEQGREITYSNSIERLVEYYEPLDIYKYKSNYGQSSDFTYKL